MQPSYYILYLYKSINKIFDRKSSLSQLRKRRGSIWGNPVCTVIRWLKFFCGERKGLGRACACRHVYVRIGAGAHRWMRMDVGGRFVGQIRNFPTLLPWKSAAKQPKLHRKSDFRVIFSQQKPLYFLICPVERSSFWIYTLILVWGSSRATTR